jgi:hypothetical protein
MPCKGVAKILVAEVKVDESAGKGGHDQALRGTLSDPALDVTPATGQGQPPQPLVGFSTGWQASRLPSRCPPTAVA